MNKILRITSAIVSILFAVGLLAAANVLAFRMPLRWDFTSDHFYSISDNVKIQLSGLSEPVEIYFFYQPLHPSYKKLRDFFKELEPINQNSIHVDYLNPDRDRARMELLAKKFKIETLNSVVIASKGGYKQLGDSDLIEKSDSETLFKAEEAVLNSIVSLMQNQKETVVFLNGHGEKQLKDMSQTGLGGMKIFFAKNNAQCGNYLFHSGKKLPGNISLLIIAGPTKKFTEPDLAEIENYVSNGGNLLLFLDPLVQTGLEPLLKKWGIGLGNQVVVDPSTGSPQISAANLFVANYGEHESMKNLKGVVTLFVVARPVFPVKEQTDWNVSALATTTPNGWGETQITTQVYQYDKGVDLLGPVSIAVAAQAKDKKSGRVVVVGDSEFATNSQLGNLGNQTFFSSIVKWAMGKKHLIELPAKKIRQIRLHLNASQMKKIFWLSIVGLPLISLGLGAMVWSRRRI